MRRREGIAGIGFGLIAAGGLLVLLSGSGAAPPQPSALAPVSGEALRGGPARLAPAASAAPVARERALPPASPAEASSRRGPAATSQAEAFRSALRAADRQAQGPERIEARRLVERVLRRKPELAPVLAEALAELQRPELAFQFARVLGRYLRDPGVRGALLGHLRSGGPVAREGAIQALTGLRGDAQVAQAIAGAYADGEAGPRVRAAAAFALGELLPELSAEVRRSARAEARRLVADSRVSAQLRGESLDLLDLAGTPADHALVTGLLDDPRASPELVLASARALVVSGAPESGVRDALGALARRPALPQATANAVKAFLETRRPAE